MHIMAGCINENDRPAAEDVFLGNLSHAASRFADAGIVALIEPINTTDMPGYFLNHTHEARRIIQRVGVPNLRLQFDCYHAQIMSGDALGMLKESFADIAHIQIAGVPDRHEPDNGECNYDVVFGMLEELNYSAWIGCEYHPKGKTEDGLEWLDRT